MKSPNDTDRERRIKESLLASNVGCLMAFLLVCGVPLMGLGGFFVYMGLSTMYSQARLNNVAISVPATIVSSSVRRSTTKTGPETGSTATSYWADIEFTYQYQNKTRTSDRVWPISEAGSEAVMREAVERYPLGEQVSALVDPNDPTMAFLEKRWSPMPYISVAIGSLPASFVIALGVWLLGWRRPRIALLSALVVGIVGILLMGMAGTHYMRSVPPGQQVSWMWLLLASSVALALGPLVMMIKARFLNQLYLEAVEDAKSV